MEGLAADGIPVAVTCRVLKIARAPYCRWLTPPVTNRARQQAYLADALFDGHRDAPEYGYRLLADEVREAGHDRCDRTSWRICRDNRWWSAFGKKRGSNGKEPGPPAHDGLVRREFTAIKPNRLWLTDITEHPTGEGKLCLCAIKDVCCGLIVGCAIADRMRSRLAADALSSAFASRCGAVAGCVVHSDRAGCVVHSDRWSQFRSRRFLAELRRHNLAGSMGQVASAGHNAAMESFFSPLQNNVLDRRRWSTRQQLMKLRRAAKPFSMRHTTACRRIGICRICR